MPRGRKSRKSQLAAVPIIPGEPPDPPEELSLDQALEWRKIVTRMPVDWFTAETFPLLIELCRHICHSRLIERQMEAVRVRYEKEGKDTLTDPEYLAAMSMLEHRHGFQTDRISRISAKLRLTPSSRYARDVAEQQVRNSGTAVETSQPVPTVPWQDWGERPTAN